MKKGILYALLTAVLFVTLEPVSKLIASDITPYAMTFWRFFVGSILLMPFAAVKMKKENLKITGKDVVRMTLLGTLCICISMVFLQVAVKKAEAPSLIAIIFSSNSVFTIIFSAILMKEKLTKNKIIALALGVIGVVLCADFKSGANISSVALALASALSFSLYIVLNQKYKSKVGGIVQTAGAFFMGSVVLLVVLLVAKIPVIPQLDAGGIWIMLYLAFFVTGLGYVAYFGAIDAGGAIMASLAFFIKPILTPFVTWIVNGIVPDVMVFVSVAFIVGASYFAVYRKTK